LWFRRLGDDGSSGVKSKKKEQEILNKSNSELFFSQPIVPKIESKELIQFKKQLKEAIVHYGLKISKEHVKFYTIDKFIDFCEKINPPINLTFIKSLEIKDQKQLELKFRRIVDSVKEKGASHQIRKFSSDLANLLDGFVQFISEIRGKSRKQKLDTQLETDVLITDIKKHRPV
jgi:ribosomal protein S7